MTDDKSRAKKLFFEYACNHFFMDREEAGTIYKKYGVSDAQEMEWRKEYIALWTGQLSADSIEAVNKLRFAGAAETLPQLIEWAEKGNDSSRLQYASAIWDLSRRTLLAKDLREQAEDTAIKIWETIAAQDGVHFEKQNAESMLAAVKGLRSR
jgi:hypothetical protein